MRLRVGAMVLGFIGGIGGYVIGILALIAGTVLGGGSEEFFGSETPTIVLIMAFPISIMGVIGAAITLAKPRAAGVLMLLSGIIMLFVGPAAGTAAGESFSIENIPLEIIPPMFSSVLLIIAGALALLARKEET